MNSELKELKLSQLIPNKKQDRRDWDSAAAREHIEKLKRSIGLELADGSLYGIRERLVVKSTNTPDQYQIIKGESRWRAGSEINPDMVVKCEVCSYEDKVIEHLDHATENSLKRDLNLFERALSIKTDKDNGLTTEQIIAVHGLSNKTVVSKYMSVFKLSPVKQKLIQGSLIMDLNLVSKLSKIDDNDIKELRSRCEGGEVAKKVIAEILARSNPKPVKEKEFRLSLNESHYKNILSLVGLDPEDLNNSDEDIELLLKSKLEEKFQPEIIQVHEE